ncbi:hypothetical protein ACINWC323_2594 [Acinetobacter sp. WC-323]|uniref:hypothetical protein n=1 Tax=Acinetobacter sp. WC-323 TaxID=903918 RepID=UPI00029DF301|nr:hypothetical protein [Acinetobacter sp. WC-323]EKU56594.1 hypothetical protein ACINWC323_2594 [Acinetobacter sp. WC-323]
MIKNITLPVFIFCALGLLACNKPANSIEPSDISTKQNHSEKVAKLNTKDQAIVNEYNQATDLITTGDLEGFQKQIKGLIPKIKSISDDKQRNKILMNIYTQLKMNQEALDLNEQLLKNNPSYDKQEFQCFLLKRLDKNEGLPQCYETAAKLIKIELDKPEIKNSPEYPYSEWSYYFFMYQAGHHEYKDKMTKLIKSTTDPKIKSDLQTAFNEEVLSK